MRSLAGCWAGRIIVSINISHRLKRKRRIVVRKKKGRRVSDHLGSRKAGEGETFGKARRKIEKTEMKGRVTKPLSWEEENGVHSHNQKERKGLFVSKSAINLAQLLIPCEKGRKCPMTTERKGKGLRASWDRTTWLDDVNALYRGVERGRE